MQWLSSFAEFVSLNELVEGAGGGEENWKVAVTFDDGYRDNIKLGLPVFEKYGMEITWFVTTKFVETPDALPWWNLIELLGEKFTGVISLEFQGDSLELDFGSEQKKNQLYQLLKFSSSDVRDKLVEQIKQKVSDEIDLPENKFARPGQVSKWADLAEVNVGNHSHSHPNMAFCDRNTLKEEVKKSEDRLSRWVNEEARWFAYPFGRPSDIDSESMNTVKNAGFKGGVTLQSGYVDEKSRLFYLPRLFVSPGWNVGTFKSRVQLADWYERIKRAKRKITGSKES